MGARPETGDFGGVEGVQRHAPLLVGMGFGGRFVGYVPTHTAANLRTLAAAPVHSVL